MIELPVTLPQDHTLFGLLGETTAQTWLAKLHQIKSANGMACVLTHPDPAPGYVGAPENEGHYAELLDRIARVGSLGTTSAGACELVADPNAHSC